MIIRILILSFYFILSTDLFAQENLQTLCKTIDPTHAVLFQGRVKPYQVMAQEVTKALTEKSSWQGFKANQLVCLMTFSAFGEENFINKISLHHHISHEKLHDLLATLNIKERKDQSLSYEEIIPHYQELALEYNRQKLNDSYKKSLASMLNRTNLYQELKDGRVWQIALGLSGDQSILWHSWGDLLQKNNEESNLNITFEIKNIQNYLKRSQEHYLSSKKQLNERDTVFYENIYHQYSPFLVALILSPFLLMLLGLGKFPKISLILLSGLLAIEVAGIILRVLISGRAPITNMYETVMFSGFGALLLAVILSFFQTKKTFLMVATFYNLLCLFMMRFSGGMLDEKISPLVPVLRDNFWLSTHVTTVILSYAAFALSWIVANVALYKKRFSKTDKEGEKYYEKLSYTSVQVGVVLLSAGIILGGVWADYSWGRFWGWDPKETWSLIVLLYYLAILHGRYTNWINADRFLVAMSLGFLTVMMAWFGVNYILAAGLHSYGFSEGGALFLGIFFALQILFVLVTKFKYQKETDMPDSI